MGSKNSSYIIYILLFVAIIALIFFNFNNGANQPVLTINQLAADIQAGKVSKIEVDGDNITATYGSSGTQQKTTKESTTTFIQQMKDLGITDANLTPDKISIQINAPSAWLGILTAAGYILPFIFLAVMFFFIFRQAQGRNNAAMSFGKSRARMFSGDHPTVTFEDVAGVEEAKEELREVVEFLREPQKFIALGARIPERCPFGRSSRNWQNPYCERPFPVKPVCHSSRFPVRNLWKCLWVSVPAGYVICLTRPNATHPALCLSMKLMPLAASVALDWAAATTNGNNTLNQMLVEMDGFRYRYQCHHHGSYEPPRYP